MNNNDLVSVIVITYNSSKTVLDALESIKRQTYLNIELIISDDCSKDDTVKICEAWLLNNKQRFNNTEIVTTKCNSGTSGNCNRGCKAAHGRWIKIIAGDDEFLDDGIEKLVNASQRFPEAKIICAKIECFGVEKVGYDHITWQHNLKLYDIVDNVEEQYWYLSNRNFIAAMGLMYERALWEEVGGYDEEVPLLEDWPMWLKLTGAGYKIFFINEIVARYRLTLTSVRSNNNYRYSVLLFKYRYLYKKENKFRILKRMQFLKKKNCMTNFIYKILTYAQTRYLHTW